MRIQRYCAIKKIEEKGDGTLLVEGIASSEAKDSQGEIIKSSAMAAALPGYLREDGTGPLREMHERWAAGKTTGINVDKDGLTRIVTHVVDPDACLKVREKVYQGFSIGGDVPAGGRNKDNPKIIEQLRLTEISLVDRPANPDALFTVIKIDDGAPSSEAEPIKKGMYTVSWAADLCQSLANLAESTEYEADFEGDKSPIPGRLKALTADFAGILRDLVAEETAELVGAAAEAEAVTMAEKPGALKKSERVALIARAFIGAVEKKGAKFSAATKKALSDHHDALGKCAQDLAGLHKAFGEMGWTDAGTADKSADAGELQKVAGERDELTKKLSAAEARAIEAEDAVAKAAAALEQLLAERQALAAQLATKGVLKLVSVEKQADSGNAGAEVKDEPQDTVSQIKKVHAGGGVRVS